jgi:threonine dehydrogenase-like Zn-dependent dehydrogenase
VSRVFGVGEVALVCQQGGAGSRKEVDDAQSGRVLAEECAEGGESGRLVLRRRHDQPLLPELFRPHPRLTRVRVGRVDVFVDNVGGDHLAAAVGALRERGRIVRVGTISQYNTPDAPPVRFNHADFVEKSPRMEGFLVRDHTEVREELYAFAVRHPLSGRLALDETVVEGFESIVEAFLSLLRGGNTGKMIVKPASA